MLKKFYVDMTHRCPLNQEAVAFLASHVGFTSVTIEYYNDLGSHERLQFVGPETPEQEVLNSNISRLNALVFLPHYYAVIARKPGMPGGPS